MDLALRSALYAPLLNQSQGGTEGQSMIPQTQAPMPPYQQMQENPQSSISSGPSPIANGSLAAIKASKQSVGMDEDEQRRAQGLAIQQFFANMANSRNTSQLGAINESISPAIKHYLAEQQRVENLNYGLLEEQERKKERQEMLMLKRQALNAKQSGIGSQDYEQKMQYVQALRDKGVIGPESTPISTYTPGERQKLFSNQLMRVERGNDSGNVLNTLEEIVKVNEEFPELATSIDRSLVESSKGKTLFDIGKLKIAYKHNPKLVTAAQKMNKLSSDLALSEIKGLGGQRVTDAMREIILETKPDTFMTHDSIKYMTDHIREQFEPFHEDGINTRKDISKHLYTPDVVMPKKNKPAEKVKVLEDNSMNGIQNTQNVGNPVLEWRANHPEAQNIPDEFILKGLQEGRLK